MFQIKVLDNMFVFGRSGWISQPTHRLSQAPTLFTPKRPHPNGRGHFFLATSKTVKGTFVREKCAEWSNFHREYSNMGALGLHYSPIWRWKGNNFLGVCPHKGEKAPFTACIHTKGVCVVVKAKSSRAPRRAGWGIAVEKGLPFLPIYWWKWEGFSLNKNEHLHILVCTLP